MIVYGSGIVNSIINKLPIELHIPTYDFCGLGTWLKERLARGDSGLNLLDSACKHQLDAATRHNKMMESIAMGKGLYLRPYKNGSGIKLHLHNEKKKLR